MNKTENCQQTATNLPSTITRKLAKGPDYSPDWRYQVAQEHLAEIKLAKIKQPSPPEDILPGEEDDYVRRLTLFLNGAPCNPNIDIDYAVRCSKTDPIANMIKAMVIAKRSAEQIAAEVGTDPVNITTFEKLFFDVRAYLENKAWLKSICTHRFLSVAFERGWPGVQEVVLNRMPKGTSRNASHLISICYSRAEAYVLGREASGTPPDAKDLQFLALLGRMCKVGLPYLCDEAEEAEPVPAGGWVDRFMKLPAGGRERVVFAIDTFLKTGVKKLAVVEKEATPTEGELLQGQSKTEAHADYESGKIRQGNHRLNVTEA